MYEHICWRKPEFENNEGLYFLIRIESNFHGYEKDGNTHHEEWKGSCRKNLHIIIFQNNRVFAAEFNDNIREIPEEWKNLSNHDSCWRDAIQSYITSKCFETFDTVHKNAPEEVHPENKNSNLSVRVHHNLFGPLFKCVSGDIESDYEESSCGYFKKLSNVEIIKKQITV